MGNVGRFVDRVPVICAAGTTSAKSEEVSSLLKQHDTCGLAEYILKDIDEKKKLQKAELRKSILFEESVKDTLRGPIDNFKLFESTAVESRFYKRAPLAKARIGVTAPAHIYNDTIIFGDKSGTSEDLYSLMLPPRKYEDVLKESQAGHKLYVLTHQDYNPSEHINRGYTEPFNSKNCFGMRVDADTSGAYTQRALYPSETKFVFKNHIQDEVERQKKCEIGKSPPKTGSLCNNSKPDLNRTYGKPVAWDEFRAKFLVYNLAGCKEKDILYAAESHFIWLRKKIHKMHGHALYDIRASVTNEYVTWEEFYKVFHKFHIPVDINRAKVMAKYYKLDKDERVNIMKLIDFMDRSIALPEIGNVEIRPYYDEQMLTTYREMSTDFQRYVPSDVEPAGAFSLPYPRLAPTYSKCDFESLPNETTADALIAPSIPTKCDLTHRDYFLPREKKEIKFLFSKATYEFTDEEFEKIWEEAKQQWTSAGDKVSVEAFLYCFNKHMNAASN